MELFKLVILLRIELILSQSSMDLFLHFIYLTKHTTN